MIFYCSEPLKWILIYITETYSLLSNQGILSWRHGGVLCCILWLLLLCRYDRSDAWSVSLPGFTLYCRWLHKECNTRAFTLWAGIGCRDGDTPAINSHHPLSGLFHLEQTGQPAVWFVSFGTNWTPASNGAHTTVAMWTTTLQPTPASEQHHSLV